MRVLKDVVYHASIFVLAIAIAPHVDKVKTLTFDNGSEFFQHEKIAKALNGKTYFAHPYSSLARGANENINGLFRQFFPKKTDFTLVTSQELNNAVGNRNNRPRKTRGFLSPNEMFNGFFKALI